MISASHSISGKEVASHYDELDAFYRDVWGDHVHHGLWVKGDEDRETAVRKLVETVAEDGGIRQGDAVCDIGCGYGATARLLAAQYGAHVTAITISAAQHAYARGRQMEHGTPEPRYLLGDWMRNELPGEAFDSAIAIESSEHMPDLRRFFDEGRRVLKPGGRLVVCAWLSCERPSMAQSRWLLEPICREGRMPQMGTETEYRRIAESAGFRFLRFRDASRQVERTWRNIAWIFLGRILSQPRYLRFLFNRHARNRVFAFTIFRLMLAYRTGAMRYGIFTFARD